MQYEKIVNGIFLSRPNRFIAYVEIEGKVETVHVKNTGRCKELLIPGCTVILEDFRNRPGFEKRKTKLDLISVYKTISPEKQLLINMDSQAPNKIVLEWLQKLPPEKAFTYIKPEYTYGNSRFDFYMEKHTPDGIQKYLMEVKGCTLEKNGIGYFPDAPTERGVKHLHELTLAVQKGYKCSLAFVIQIPGVETVLPNTETHPEFGQALEEAKKCGVEILFLPCKVLEDSVGVEDKLVF